MSDLGKDIRILDAVMAIVLTVYAFIARMCYKRIWEMPEKYALKDDCNRKQAENKADNDKVHSRITDLGKNMDGRFDKVQDMLIKILERRNEPR